MSLVRITTSNPTQTYALWDLFTQRGLHAVVLSPTEIGIECDELPKDLGDALAGCSSSITDQGLHEISSSPSFIDTQSRDTSTESHAQDSYGPIDSSSEDYDQEYSSQREFILAPHWRAARTSLLRLLASMEARGQRIQQWLDSRAQQLHEAEERVLRKGRARDEAREAAEARVWESSVQPNWSVVTFMNGKLSNGKSFVLAGGLVMAALFALGLLLSRHSHPSLTATQANAAVPTAHLTSAPAAPVHRSSSKHMRSVQAKKAVAPPAPQVAAAHRAPALPAAKHAHHTYKSYDDEPEVVTHYYTKNQAPQIRKASYDGVKYYSDLD